MTMILDLQNRAGLDPIKSASTGGGEYSSPCPACGGRDRFRFWPEQDRYWCRQCGKTGDSIQYLRDFHGMTFKEAADQVGKVISSPARAKRKATLIKPTPPSAEWSTVACRLVAYAHAALLGNHDALAWLKTSRGLTIDTVKRHKLGWLDKDHYRNRAVWGLPKATRDNGRQKKMFIPSGLVIPYQEHGKATRIRIRRCNPGKWGRYYILPGSSTDPMILTANDLQTNPAIIVESELDAILIGQEIKSLYSIISLGSASTKPDSKLSERLKSAPYIIVSLDADQPGDKATRYWLDTFQNAAWFPMPKEYGKDQTEAFLNGLDLNLWLKAAAIEVCNVGKPSDSKD